MDSTVKRKETLWEKRSHPISSVPVDLFRILTGLLVIAYFFRLFSEYETYTSELGLLDHKLHRQLFWFTKLSLFFPGSPDFYKMGLLILGFLATLCLTFGFRPKLGAVVAWIVVVSVQR